MSEEEITQPVAVPVTVKAKCGHPNEKLRLVNDEVPRLATVNLDFFECECGAIFSKEKPKPK